MIHVVAGVLIDAGNRVLIAQRPPGKHLAGSWEFPGGKLEAGESRIDGLARELKEELGVDIGPVPRPLLRLTHAYDYGSVLLDIFVVTDFSGEPQGLDGQALRWCSRAELEQAQLLPADRPIVRALRLPPHIRLGETSALLARGIDIVEFPFDAAGGGADRIDADAVIRGCHCNADQAAAASSQGAAFLVLRQPLGAAALTQLCASVGVPVFARDSRPEWAWRAGASGIAT